MYDRPFTDEVQSAGRQPALKHLHRVEVDCGLEFTVSSMKMGRWMIVENMRIRIP
jgi:hypothetical protein